MNLIKPLLGNDSLNTRATQQHGGSVLYVVRATQGMSSMFSACFVPGLYNGSVFAAEIKWVEYRLVQSQA
jgi:hypothetical protein